MSNIIEIHKKYTAKLFKPFSSEDERFLALALCGEVGEIANKIKKRWRDDADLSAEIREEIADARVYLELLATCFGIGGWKLDQEVERKLAIVAERMAKPKRKRRTKAEMAAAKTQLESTAGEGEV